MHNINEPTFTVQDGRLYHAGQPFFSVGFNYHPSATGCQYWTEWDAAQIDADLRQMAEYGFNTIRFFIFWADFEPAPGEYDITKLERLHKFVSIVRRHGLYCIPALLTIWMNGQLFDLGWRKGRDLWTDADMVAREVAYVHRIAETLRDLDNILAYDLGDEVIHVDFSVAQSLSREAVATWQQTLADTIRTAAPGVLVLQGNEASAVVGQHAFRPDNSSALDLLAIHGFPVWSPFAIESISSYKASNYLSFLVRFTSAYGLAFVDEMGCYGGDEQTANDYLRIVTHSILANGASGAIVWCWQDFTTTDKPYALRPSERFVGLLDSAGNPKSTFVSFQSFAQQATREWAHVRIPSAPIGVYIPDQYNPSGENYLHVSVSSAPALFYAYLLLKRAHLPFEFTRGSFERYQLVICPSMQHITLREQEALARYVAQGGNLYYSTADYLHGFGGEELFGIQLKDFTLASRDQDEFTWMGMTYPIIWAEADGRPVQIPVIRSSAASVLASFPNGAPALTRHTYGQGVAYYLNAPFEQQLNSPYRLQVTGWERLYAVVAESVGVERELDCDAPDVELAVLAAGQQRYGFVMNHGTQPVVTTLTHEGAHQQVITIELRLESKGVHVLTWEM